LISGASDELTARIEQLIRSQAELSLVKSVSPGDATSETFKAKLVWVELESDPEGNVALLEQLIKSHPNTFFVVSKEDLEPELVKRAMQVGALDFLDHKGWAAQIRSVVRRIMAKEFGSKPTTGGAIQGSARSGQKPGSWSQLNSLKVSPSSSGFRRVEPNRAQSAPQAAQPQAPEPEEVPVEEVEIPVEQVEIPVEEAGEVEQYPQEAVPYEEAEQAYAEAEGEVAYAAGEQPYAEGEQPYSDEGEQPYAAEGYSDGEASYSEGQEAEGEYAQDEQPYAEEGVEYTGEEAVEQYDEPQTEQPYDQTGDEAYDPEAVEESVPEEIEEPEAATTDGAEEEFPQAPAKSAPAAPKGRWDELDSIISTSDKKPASKWDDLGSIQTTKKEAPASKWGDLDSITTAKGSTSKDAEPSGASKWGDLDAIGKAGGEKDAPAAPSGSKWGDLDSVGSAKSFKKDEPSEAAPSGSKWGDLNSIGAKSSSPEPEPQESGGNKWGNLDSIGAKGGAQKSNTRSFIKPKAPDESAAPAKSKWGDIEGLEGAVIPDAESPTPQAKPAANKWGNLDSIGTPGAGGEADAGPSSFKNRFGKKTQQVDMPSLDSAPASGPSGGNKWGNLDSIGAPAAGGADVGKWGNLNSIPTPKSGSEFGDLDSIPTPKADKSSDPSLVEGSLPQSQSVNEASQKWKAGMSSDLSTGARQMVEMRDKIKGTKVSVKIGWNNVNILLAVAIVASVGYLSVQFFAFPEPPVQQTAGK